MTKTIDASPTKEFFIDMLTRDIALDRSLLDLIDNSVDAARENNIENAWIKIYFKDGNFVIHDNCGGMDIYSAQNYAFRFGRPKNNPATPNSVGQFGVGMKRTLFKLGKKFKVYSKKKGEAFSIDIDVDKWKVDDKDWTFNIEFNDAIEVNNGETKIIVSDIYPDISEQLSLQTFINSLSQEISSAHFMSINSGLNVYINDEKVSNYHLTLLHSDELGVYSKEFNIDNVSVKITAGISERKLEAGGWYIVCNGRLVESANQNRITGWQLDGIPKYHPDYAFFRGVVEFNCEDSSKLPWTTTKTGVDRDNSIYRVALNYMKIAMRPIISFLRERAKEDMQFKNGLLDSKPLNESIGHATHVQLNVIEASDVFERPPAAERKDMPEVATIQYTVLASDIEKAKLSLNVSTNKEVGEETFNYYMSYECKNG
ncbi:ATP-binding protein [Salmonella enterica subsp. enterica serovar Carrau]|uniref:ATP-binding protein n=3 Tax=Salmonella enterica TaxID=28901 RepID=A0A756I1D3_SALER|nr:ATP-binding protein [Salmonella enterica]EBS5236006.1 ATP-binding protein [Salmonella enterica subsp. enterica serovar Onderstepoort]EBW7253219.1 ATP-binding protein [Salmonella enterica subsp. enterica serovar Gatow]ECG1136656.1 ATP-binding protein [Salmonella enterica subsp. enterica]ECI0232021.1 ATP-binding protein [Salmonella enterica subsp. enterica serovar Bahrenfeld]ECT8081348.1 ATP-binding protein [Salmonella enterica subsp. enterica serovar Carrau]EEK5903682.1 ATP-binding protein 